MQYLHKKNQCFLGGNRNLCNKNCYFLTNLRYILYMDENQKDFERLKRAFNIKDGEDIWVFAYGSLMWNPDFVFEEVQPAHVCGYHRRFCLKCDYHRGKPEAHGLVLGLDRGGSCHGLAYRLAPQHLHKALSMLWKREMWVADAYLPRRVPVTINNDFENKIPACVFVSNPKSSYYYDEKCRKKAAEIISKANGLRGSNFEYLERTVHSLRDYDIHDPQIEDIYNHTLTSQDALVTAEIS